MARPTPGFWVDPADDLVLAGTIQRLGGPSSPNEQELSHTAAYHGLLDPKMQRQPVW